MTGRSVLEMLARIVGDLSADSGTVHFLDEGELLQLAAAKPANRRVCLPPEFGAAMTQSASVPVSFLEHVSLGLSAGRFGYSRSEVDDVIVTIVSGIYRCGLHVSAGRGRVQNITLLGSETSAWYAESLNQFVNG